MSIIHPADLARDMLNAIEFDKADALENYQPTTITAAELTLLRQGILANLVATPYIGKRYKLSDGLLANKIVEWNGEAFSSCSGNLILRNANMQEIRTSDGTAGDTVLYEFPGSVVTIPGFLMGKNSRLRIHNEFGFSALGTAISKGVAITFSGGDLGGGASSNSAIGTVSDRRFHEVRNMSSFTAQKSYNGLPGYGVSNNAQLSFAKNTLEDTILSVSVNWATTPGASQTITLFGSMLELVP